MSPEAAELAYLTVAQQLPLYGLHFFPSHNSKGVPLLLGVSVRGLLVSRPRHPDQPAATFLWRDIRKISYTDTTVRVGGNRSNQPIICFRSLL